MLPSAAESPPAERSTKALYSPEVLAAAVGLADFPIDPDLPLRGEARSRSCGSTLRIALSVDAAGRIERIGCRAQACAVGQAAAYVFVSAASEQTFSQVETARATLAAWLAGTGRAPDWRGIELLDAARAHPGRHGAILLAWDAALAALASPSRLR